MFLISKKALDDKVSESTTLEPPLKQSFPAVVDIAGSTVIFTMESAVMTLFAAFLAPFANQGIKEFQITLGDLDLQVACNYDPGYGELIDGGLTLHTNLYDLGILSESLASMAQSRRGHIHMEPIFIDSSESVYDIVFDLSDEIF